MGFLIVLTVTAIVLFIISAAHFRKNALRNIVYQVHTDVHEIYEGQDFFLYESIANAKDMPLPNVRMDVTLPKGLEFCLYEKNRDGSHRTTQLSTIESVFVLKGASAVERRWRVMAIRRGVYHLGTGRMVVCDIFGANKLSCSYNADGRPSSTVTVLPSPIDIEKHFTPVRDPMGDTSTPFSSFSDPLLYAGSREYRPGDSQNRINWKASARMHSPMVNLDEYTEKNHFDLIFNLQSRAREDTGTTPEGAEMVELGVSVCASIFDMACSEDVPVRMFCNTANDLSEKDYFISDYFSGRADAREALRMLAEIELKLSCRVEDMLEDILKEAADTDELHNVILVTSYIDEAIVDFAHGIQELGAEIVIYATSSFRSLPALPEDIPIYYKTFK